MPWNSKQPDLKNNPAYLEPRVTANETQLAEIVKKDIVKNYGAITTGTTYPLSNKFTTLASAQAKYPNAGITALTQELNWAIFNQAFYDANVNHYELSIPAGSYYISSPLNPIGASVANNSIENTTFSIKGEGIGSTILIFNFTGDTTFAMDIVAYTAKMIIGGFTIKNLQSKQGCGLRVNGLFSGDIHDILSIYFYIGADITTYITKIKNLTGAYCSCGIIWRSGTSTTISSCYASNAVKRDVNDTADWAGVGHYILGYVYSTFENIACDGCSQPYKFSGSSSTRLKLLDCGAEQGGASQAVYVNNPNAFISIEGLSLSGITGLLNVQSVGNIELFNIIDYSIHNSIFATGVTPGQVRVNSKLPTISNPSSMTGKTPSINKGVRGIGDLVYDLINMGSSYDFIQNGRGIFRGNQLEFTLTLPSNGNYASITANVMATSFYNTVSTNYRGGVIEITAFNNGGTVYAFSKSTDTNIFVTITTVSATQVKVLLDPFNTVPSPTAHQAMFDVWTYSNADSHDMNIKTNRTTITIKGVDY